MDEFIFAQSVHGMFFPTWVISALHTVTAAESFSCNLYNFIAGSLESAYSLIWGSHKIWGKGGGDTLDLLW